MFKRLAKSRLFRGFSANLYGQIIQIFIQLTAVPLFVTHWGVSVYGTWLMLSTIPSYLALADFGFAGAAANDMTMSLARGDRQTTLATFQGVRVTVMATCLAFFALAAAFLFLFPNHWLDGADKDIHGHARGALLVLIGYGLLALQNSVSLAGYRATGLFALGTYLQNTILLTENIAVFVSVGLGGGIEEAVVSYFVVRLLGGLMLAVVLARRESWLMTLRWHSSLAHIRRLIAPALAVMTLPAAQALFLQGTVLALGAAVGNAVVPTFTTVRTVSRIAIQLTGLVTHALMPEFTMAAARHDHDRKARLAFLNVATSVIVLVPMVLFILLSGRTMVALWTHGAIHPSFELILTFSVMMVLNGIWYPIANLILALNEHARYTYFYMIAAFVAVLLSYPLARAFGATGPALALALLDAVMLVKVGRLARQLGVIDPAQLRKSAEEGQIRLRRMFAR